MRVLLVDDNEELREFLALCLTEQSIEVVAVGDASAAQKRAEGEKFDAFVIDSFLGKDDGLSLARRMAQDAGCNEFLVKPFGQMQFIEQVRALERQRR